MPWASALDNVALPLELAGVREAGTGGAGQTRALAPPWPGCA